MVLGHHTEKPLVQSLEELLNGNTQFMRLTNKLPSFPLRGSQSTGVGVLKHWPEEGILGLQGRFRDAWDVKGQDHGV